MDILLVAFQIAFFAPLLARLAKHDLGAMAATGLGAELRAGTLVPAMALHGAGALLLWAAIALALAKGQVPRAPTTAGLIGAAIVLFGAALFGWAVAALRSWRLVPTIAPGHALCTTGPYALVRHPMYLAIDLLGVGTAIWVGSLPAAVAAAMLVAGGLGRARQEERALLEAFGDEYRAYMARVRRLIPGLY